MLFFSQDNWKDQLCKIFVNLNLLFRIIDNSNFRKLLEILRPNLVFLDCIKLLKLIFTDFDQICNKIKSDLKKS